MSWKIGELAEELDATPRAIRFYEEQGLLTPTRSGGTRVYEAGDRVRLKLILRGRRLGFSLDEIREMIWLYEVGEGEVRQLEHCLRVGRERIEVLERQKRDVEAALEELRGFEERFVSLLEAAGVEEEGRGSRT